MSKDNFKELKVWQKCRSFTKEIYSMKYSFPDDEKFDLIRQLRRATISITNNIAEWCGRNSDKQLVQFLQYSYCSAVEVENVLILASDLHFRSKISFKDFSSELIQIQKMLFALVNIKSNI
ncbi:MAG: four helix bundle protein [Bacteroidia bacterium]